MSFRYQRLRIEQSSRFTPSPHTHTHTCVTVDDFIVYRLLLIIDYLLLFELKNVLFIVVVGVIRTHARPVYGCLYIIPLFFFCFLCFNLYYVVLFIMVILMYCCHDVNALYSLPPPVGRFSSPAATFESRHPFLSIHPQSYVFVIFSFFFLCFKIKIAWRNIISKI